MAEEHTLIRVKRRSHTTIRDDLRKIREKSNWLWMTEEDMEGERGDLKEVCIG